MVYAALDITTIDFAPAKFANISSFINLLIPFTTIGAALVFLAMALLGGFSWITSGGNQENLAKAQKTFIYALIGLLIVVFAFVLTRVIGYILNVQILQ